VFWKVRRCVVSGCLGMGQGNDCVCVCVCACVSGLSVPRDAWK